MVENKDECDPAIYRTLRSNICASGSKYSCPAHISSVSPSKYRNNRKSKASVFLSFARECRVLCTGEPLKYFIRFLACIFTSMAAGPHTSTGEDVCQRERKKDGGGMTRYRRLKFLSRSKQWNEIRLYVCFLVDTQT